MLAVHFNDGIRDRKQTCVGQALDYRVNENYLSILSDNILFGVILSPFYQNCLGYKRCLGLHDVYGPGLEFEPSSFRSEAQGTDSF